MSSPPVNQKSFKLINRISETFSMAISNFAYATTLLFRLSFRIGFITSPQISVQAVTNLIIKRIRIIISQVKLIANITQTINAKKISFVINFRQIVSNTLLVPFKLGITAISSARQKIVSTILIKKVVITASPTLATFFSLGYYDPETLGDLDGLTLGEMDCTT